MNESTQEIIEKVEVFWGQKTIRGTTIADSFSWTNKYLETLIKKNRTQFKPPNMFIDSESGKKRSGHISTLLFTEYGLLNLAKLLRNDIKKSVLQKVATEISSATEQLKQNRKIDLLLSKIEDQDDRELKKEKSEDNRRKRNRRLKWLFALGSIITAIATGISSTYLKDYWLSYEKNKQLISYSVTLNTVYTTLAVEDKQTNLAIKKLFRAKHETLNEIYKFSKFQELHPEWGNLIASHIATLLIHLGNERKAIEFMNVAVLKEIPNHYMAVELTGVAFMKLAQRTKDPKNREEYLFESERHFRKNLENHPKRGLSYYNLGLLFELNEQHKRADDFFLQAIKLGRAKYTTYSWLRWIYTLRLTPEVTGKGIYASVGDHYGYFNTKFEPVDDVYVDEIIYKQDLYFLKYAFMAIEKVQKLEISADAYVDMAHKQYSCTKFDEPDDSTLADAILWQLCAYARHHKIYKDSASNFDFYCATGHPSAGKSIELWKKLITNRPKACSAYHNRGLRYKELKKYKLARYDFKKSFACDEKKLQSEKVSIPQTNSLICKTNLSRNALKSMR